MSPLSSKIQLESSYISTSPCVYTVSKRRCLPLSRLRNRGMLLSLFRGRSRIGTTTSVAGNVNEKERSVQDQYVSYDCTIRDLSRYYAHRLTVRTRLDALHTIQMALLDPYHSQTINDHLHAVHKTGRRSSVLDVGAVCKGAA